MTVPHARARAATAFGPATVANVAVGFDVLGFALPEIGDRVQVAVEPGSGVRIASVRGVVPELPMDPARNTASVALLALIDLRQPAHGFRIAIEKGIPLGSGMGGSAASAVAAVVAANRLLENPLAQSELLRCAVAGERAASGAAHADNVAPCLLGGMTAVVAHDPLEVVSIPLPDGLTCVLVHPHLEIETRRAREVLPRELPLHRHVSQSMRLAGFLTGCFRGDLALIARSMEDLIAEPSRSQLIPGFAAARAAALAAGALSFAIAGSGPSVFAWTADRQAASRIESVVRSAFADQGLGTDGWVVPVGGPGAHVVTVDPAP